MLTKLKRLVTVGGDLPDNKSSIQNGTLSTTNHVSALPISLQRKFARGVSYNLKIIVRGDRNVGKSALLHRMQHLPFCDDYVPTEEIKVVNINWDHKLSDEVVKVELWEVVDKCTKKPDGVVGTTTSGPLKTSNSSFSLSNVPPPSPNNTKMALDAESIDVYRGASGVIVIVDLTKKWTVDYLQREIVKIPMNLPVLVLANHKDMYHHAVVTPEQVRSIISELNLTRTKIPDEHQQGLIIYAESSMRNGFGLKFIDKFFSLPFLYLQRATLLAQLQTNARDVRAMHQELNLQNDENYENFLENLTTKRRAVAEEHAKTTQNTSTVHNLPTPIEKPKNCMPKSPPPGTSIAETVPASELMSNPKYKIEYPTLEQQLSWQKQQHQRQSSQKSSNLVAEPTKSRPSIIIGGGKPIPGSHIMPVSVCAVSGVPNPVENENASSDDEFEVVQQQNGNKKSSTNPMVAHSDINNTDDDDDDRDTISVDYQHTSTTAGDALDAAEQNSKNRAVVASRQNSQRFDEKFADFSMPTTENDAEALRSLADIAQRQEQASSSEPLLPPATPAVDAVPPQAETPPILSAIEKFHDNRINDAISASSSVAQAEAKKPRKLKKNIPNAEQAEPAKKSTKKKTKKKSAGLVHNAEAADAVSSDIYKDYEPI